MLSGHVNICPTSKQEKSINCSGYGAIIRIDNVLAAYIENIVNCDVTSQGVGLPGNPQLECRAWQKEAYYRYFTLFLLFSYRIRSQEH